MLPVESTEMKMIAFMMCASGASPAFRYAMTKGEAFVPEPPKIFGSCGETVMVTISEPMM